MPFSVELFLDPKSAQHVSGLRERLVAAEVPTGYDDAGFQPHVTLILCEELDAEAFSKAFKAFGERVWFPTLTMGYLGLVQPPTGELFLGVTPRERLMDLQRELFHLVSDHAELIWEQFHPGQWVPHCPLAQGLTPGQIPRAFSALSDVRLPIDAEAHAIAIVDTATRRVIQQVLQ